MVISEGGLIVVDARLDWACFGARVVNKRVRRSANP